MRRSILRGGNWVGFFLSLPLVTPFLKCKGVCLKDWAETPSKKTQLGFITRFAFFETSAHFTTTPVSKQQISHASLFSGVAPDAWRSCGFLPSTLLRSLLQAIKMLLPGPIAANTCTQHVRSRYAKDQKPTLALLLPSFVFISFFFAGHYSPLLHDLSSPGQNQSAITPWREKKEEVFSHAQGSPVSERARERRTISRYCENGKCRVTISSRYCRAKTKIPPLPSLKFRGPFQLCSFSYSSSWLGWAICSGFSKLLITHVRWSFFFFLSRRKRERVKCD